MSVTVRVEIREISKERGPHYRCCQRCGRQARRKVVHHPEEGLPIAVNFCMTHAREHVTQYFGALEALQTAKASE